MSYSFLAPAKQELQEAIAFYDDLQPGLGTDFESEAQSAINRILDNPLIWPQLPHTTVRRCRLRRFPYGLIYQFRNGHALIVAVMHLRRRSEYWRSRLNR